MKSIDLNCDMGEFPQAVSDGTQESLMEFVTSVNIACGGHAGDALTIRATVEQALRRNLAIGAHPGYPDRVNFGRLEMKLPHGALVDTVFEQVSQLADLARESGGSISHVKAHGALYNQAARDTNVAYALAEGVRRWRRDTVLVGLANSQMLDVFRRVGFPVAAEAFADRRYEPDGSLRSRKFADALILDPAEAAEQALHIAQRGKVLVLNGADLAVQAQTLCIHGDTPGAPKIAAAVAERLKEVGVRLRPLRAEA